MGSVIIDDLDRRLLHALQVDGRASFARIGRALGVSDQTVARRCNRLRERGRVRVVGAVDGSRFGYPHWYVRLACAPDAAGAIAEALARRDDTSWVHLISGGTEIVASVTSRSPEERDQLLMERLPRTGRIVSMSAHEQLHVFAGGPTGWHGLLQALDDDEVAALDPPPVDRSGPAVAAEPGDRALLDLLALDGRTSCPVLAAGTGSSESAVRRRVEALRATGALFFDLDVPAAVLGYGAEARLWMSVAPGMLAAVGEAVARHPEVTFVAATTGTTNLMAAAVCRTTADLYRYLTERLGALEGIREVETAPVLRVVKRAGAVLPR